MNQVALIYRKAKSVDELEALLRLRYATYVESGLREFLAEAKDQIDMDAFDLRATHFGLFCENDKKPVGYLRRVQDSVTPQAPVVNAIVKRHPEHEEAVRRPTCEAFPLLSYFPDRDVIRERYYYAQAHHRRMAEVGRLSLDKPVRGITAAKFFVEATMAAGIVEGFQESVITLAWSHRAFYKRFGFRQLEGTGNHVELGVTVSCMHWVKENMPEAVRDEIYRMADEYALTEQIKSNGHTADGAASLTHPHNIENASLRNVA